VRTGDQPFEVCLTALLMTWGAVSLLALAKVSGSSARIIPAWGIYLFFGCLTAGCALALFGVAMVRFRQNLRGLEIERAGLTLLGGLCFAYSLWTLAAAGPRALSFVLVVGGVWTAAVWRVWEITVDLKEIDKAGRS
jgi:hypothetical protein